jgi:hypothetical protein
MRTPDQDERAEEGTLSEAFGDGFGSVDQGDLNDGYGTDSFDDDDYSEPEVADDPVDESDDTFDDAAEDEGGFGGPDDGTTETGDTTDTTGGIDVDDDGAMVVPTGAEATEDDPDNIIEEIIDDVLGGDAGEAIGGVGDTYAVDGADLLDGLDDPGFDGDDGTATSAINNSGDGVFDSAFDQPEVGDAADFVTESDFDLNADGHVDHGDLREAAHPFDFHADG